MDTTYQAPNDADIDLLAKMWLFIGQRMNEHFGINGQRGQELLLWVQLLLDEKAIEETEYAGKALGCVLGMTLVDQIQGLDWAVCIDDYGRDLCLRYKDTPLIVFPLDMILRRR